MDEIIESLKNKVGKELVEIEVSFSRGETLKER